MSFFGSFFKKTSLTQIEQKCGYRFKNKSYLDQAFLHRSISTKPRENYERLEFLGDAVIDIIVSRELMREFPEGDDGLKSAKKVILSTIWSHRELAWESVNFKGKLIELCHTKQMDNPKFLVSNVSGPEHKKLFEVKVKIGNNYYPSGIGSNKKTAEQQAAQLAIDSITD